MKYTDADYLQITGGAFHDFLVSKGVNTDCPTCGNEDVAIMASSADDPVQTTYMAINSPPNMAGSEVPFIALVCRSCGHARFFQAGNVLDWVREEHNDG